MENVNRNTNEYVWRAEMVTQASGILLWIMGLMATGFGAGLFAGLALARKWRRQREAEEK